MIAWKMDSYAVLKGHVVLKHFTHMNSFRHGKCSVIHKKTLF